MKNLQTEIFRFICLIILITVSFHTNAQKYSIENKKAQKLFEKALVLFKEKSFTEAEKNLQKAIETEKNFVECYLLLSDIYTQTSQTEKKISAMKNAGEINPTFSPYLFYNLAVVEWEEGLYQDANLHILRFESLNKEPEMTDKILLLKEKTAFALDWIKNPIEFKPVNLGEKVNTKYNDYFPILSGDKNKLIFTVSIPKEGISEIKQQSDTQEDFFYSEINKNGEFSEIKNMGGPINTPGNEGAQTISPDGKYLFFTSCDNQINNNFHGKSYGSCDIFYSEITNGVYSKPKNIGEPINTNFWESQPSISADSKTLYFCSNRPGGYGKSDIYKSEKDENGNWGIPTNIGPNINTQEQDQAPFIHPDNKTLYFASSGHTGMGKSDFFISVKDSLGLWTKAKNLGYPINDRSEQFSLTVSYDGKDALFSAQYPDTRGGLDIYKFSLPKELKPKPIIYVKGKIFDSQTKQNLDANIEIALLEKKSDLITSKSDKNSGSFLFYLQREKEYAINISKNGYLFHSESFSLKNINDTIEFISLDIALEKIEYGKSVILKNIFFETDSYILKSESNIELNKLYDFLIRNTTLKVEIGGHTDNVGSKEKNMTLSKNRAQTVYHYLIDRGIEKERLKYQGYAFDVPIADNSTSQGRALNRRTEFKIIE